MAEEATSRERGREELIRIEGCVADTGRVIPAVAVWLWLCDRVAALLCDCVTVRLRCYVAVLLCDWAVGLCGGVAVWLWG